MPVKVTLSLVTVEEREVEAPDRCPNPECRADLRAPDAIRADGWMEVSQNSHLVGDELGTGDRLEWGDDYKDHFESQVTDALYCNACGEQVVDANQARQRIAAAANEIARLTRRPGEFPVLTDGSSREDIISWLQANDPNGSHEDRLAALDDIEPYTEERAWEALKAVVRQDD